MCFFVEGKKHKYAIKRKGKQNKDIIGTNLKAWGIAK